VLATTATGPLHIHGQGGADTDNIGNNGSVAGILGPISIDNAAGLTALRVDASADTSSHNILLSGAPTATLTNLTTAPMTYAVAEISTLTIDTGPSGNQVLNVDFSSG